MRLDDERERLRQLAVSATVLRDGRRVTNATSPGRHELTITVSAETTSAPQRALQAAPDFSNRRADLWPEREAKAPHGPRERRDLRRGNGAETRSSDFLGPEPLYAPSCHPQMVVPPRRPHRSIRVAAGALVFFETDGRTQFGNIRLQFVVAGLLREVVHEIGKPIGDRVQLVLGRLVLSALTVLQQRDKQERDDRRCRVDLKLIGRTRERGHAPSRESLHESLNDPQHDEENAEREEGCAARDARDQTGAPVEETDSTRDVARHEHVCLGFVHDQYCQAPPTFNARTVERGHRAELAEHGRIVPVCSERP